MEQTKLEAVLEKIAPFLPDPDSSGKLEDGKVMSLLYPRPDADENVEKFDLVKKNLLSALDEEARGPAAMRQGIRKVVESLTRQDMPEGGIAVFSDGQNTLYEELDHHPRPRLGLGSAALALPLLADARRSRRFWIAILDAEEPRLLHVDGHRIHDKTPSEVPSLSETMKQYHPMASVLWHSSSSVRRSGARQQFHALGTATEDLKKDQITQVLNTFGKQVSDQISGSGDPLVLAGGPSRIGHFKDNFDHRNLIDEHVEAAGDALADDEIFGRAFEVIEDHYAGERSQKVSDIDTTNALRGEADLLKAAHRGRIETLLLHPDHAGFLSGDDERLQLPEEPDEAFRRLSEIVSYALKHGAALHLTERDTENGPLATTRYD